MHPDTTYTLIRLAAQAVLFGFIVIVVAVFVDRLLEFGELLRRRSHLNVMKADADAKLKAAYERQR